MTRYQSALTIDLGEVGTWRRKTPFRVCLDSGPLEDMIYSTDDGHRLYELLLIDRPGDIWDYIWIALEEGPQSVVDRITRARHEAQPEWVGVPHPWPDDRMPINVFDRLFCWAGDDTDPEVAAWLHHRESEPIHLFARQTLSIVRAAQSRLDCNDELFRYLSFRVRSGQHPFSYLDRDVARQRSQEFAPIQAQHTSGFYNQLGRLLGDADLASVAYRGEGDSRILRMMATEQRRRANCTGHEVGNALFLSALVNHRISNEAWESEIWFSEEGLAHGDLHIEGGGLGGGNLKMLVESNYRNPGKFILSGQDEGDITGFVRKSGDGWVLYTKENPDVRRMTLQRIQPRRRSELGEVLSFADNTATLFDFEKTVILVGDEVTLTAREVLASVIVEWQSFGGEPLLWVMGETGPFGLAGCKGTLSCPPDCIDDESQAHWLMALLQNACPWVDVLLNLHAPEWAERVLADHLQNCDGPWSAWVVGTKGRSPLKIDHTLNGDLARVLSEARQRAKRMRSLESWV